MTMYNHLLIPNAELLNNIQVGATNLLIKLELREGYGILDISDATVKNIVIEKPGSTVMTKTATFSTDGTDGLIYYRTVAGDLNEAGTYQLQAYIEMPDFSGYSTIQTFAVTANLG